jgi:hypothetical protein
MIVVSAVMIIDFSSSRTSMPADGTDTNRAARLDLAFSNSLRVDGCDLVQRVSGVGVLAAGTARQTPALGSK